MASSVRQGKLGGRPENQRSTTITESLKTTNLMPDSQTDLSKNMSDRPTDNQTKAKPAKRGRPVGDREAKRKELLSAAISVIASEGYAGASMRKVAKKAGHTTGAVTYYFANKEEMVAAVADNLWDQFDATLEVDHEAVDVRTIIQQWMDWTRSEDSDTWLAVFQLLAHARHEPVFASVIRERYTKFRQALAVVLARGQEQGVVRDDIRADLLADQLSAISDGWLMLLPIEPERFTPDRSEALLDAAITLISPASA